LLSHLGKLNSLPTHSFSWPKSMTDYSCYNSYKSYKHVKYPGINLMKEVEYFYNEKYKHWLKEMKENTQIHIHGRLSHAHGLEEFILLCLYYSKYLKIQYNHIQIPTAFLTELEKTTLKFMWLPKFLKSWSNLSKTLKHTTKLY
jgi:hypothetical protein